MQLTSYQATWKKKSQCAVSKTGAARSFASLITDTCISITLSRVSSFSSTSVAFGVRNYKLGQSGKFLVLVSQITALRHTHCYCKTTTGTYSSHDGTKVKRLETEIRARMRNINDRWSNVNPCLLIELMAREKGRRKASPCTGGSTRVLSRGGVAAVKERPLGDDPAR